MQLFGNWVIAFPRHALLTIYRSFIRSHLGYGDVIYDQPENDSFSNNINTLTLHDGGRYHIEISPWFLYDNGLRHERVKCQPHSLCQPNTYSPVRNCTGESNNGSLIVKCV